MTKIKRENLNKKKKKIKHVALFRLVYIDLDGSVPLTFKPLTKLGTKVYVAFPTNSTILANVNGLKKS